MDADQVKKFVLDDWEWTHHFKSSTDRYVGSNNNEESED